MNIELQPWPCRPRRATSTEHPRKALTSGAAFLILEEVETLGLGVSMGILFLVEAGEKRNKKHNSVSIY